MIRVHIVATLKHDDVEDLQRLLQVVRTWDNGRASVHAQIQIDAPALSMQTVHAVLQTLKPPFTGVAPTVIRMADDECKCRTPGCNHVASAHNGPGGACMVAGCQCGPGGWS
jgi:hypothetical protein